MHSSCCLFSGGMRSDPETLDTRLETVYIDRTKIIMIIQVTILHQCHFDTQLCFPTAL